MKKLLITKTDMSRLREAGFMKEEQQKPTLQEIVERQGQQIKELQAQVASLMKLRHVDDVCPKCDGNKEDWRKMCVNCAG